LAVNPKFILLDEPFAGVDPIAVEDIQAIVARLKYKNIGILITDHNVNETLSICDRAYLLIDGKIFEHGTAEELAANEQVRRLYLGRNFELKRKDYLHDEAEQSSQEAKEQSSFSTKNSLSLLQEIDYTISQTDIIIKYLDNRTGGIPVSEYTSPDIVDYESYFNSYNQLKNKIEKHQAQTKSSLMKKSLSELPLLDYKKYARILSFERSHLFSSGFLQRAYVSIKLYPFLDKLYKAKTVLGKIEMEIKSEAN